MSIEIFLDTNVFESANFSYASKNMLKFLSYCRDNDIKLKITDVVKHEVEKRIKTNILDSFEEIKKHNLGVLAASVHIDPSISKLKLIELLINNLKNDFNDFIEDNDIEIINSNYEVLELVTQYFEKRTPFTEQKKHEFPDAIILLTIKKYITDNQNKTIITISNDASFIDFSTNNGVENFNLISNALNYLIQNPNAALQNAFDRQLEKIKKQIIERIEYDNDFILYSYDSIDLVDIDDTTVEEVTINDLNILQFEQGDNTLSLDSNLIINLSCNAYYHDPDTVRYDKEDGKYYSFTKCQSKINFNENVICSLEITFDEDFNFDIIELELHNKEFEFYLDERYIINTKYEIDESNNF